MQIVTSLYFKKQNQINIPLAANIPTANVIIPSNQSYIDALCVSVEKSILLNALGVTLYNQFQIALNDIDNVVNDRWKLLLNGENYGNKSWIGLNHDLNLIAQRVYETYVTETNSQLTQSGNVQANSENAILVSPSFKIANANQSFIKQYQGINSIYPEYHRHGIDWGGDCDETEVSMYRYLVDKAFEFENFKFYDTKNTFGI